ncbi:Hypothetical predicted protein [Paramuricea clavata]|uniref:Uncharacterized protein n=2 Tax=Paramuricea clavata TaxID=317549 RepID=A0A7D9M786_PARCT|nr:Hypothetical predicted protein [Paramuricea clavata]
MFALRAPCKESGQKWNNTIKYFGENFLIGLFLPNLLAKVSVVNILCVVALGTSLTTFNALSSYGLISLLPWFSKKSTVTLSIVSYIRVIGLVATIIDVIPDNTGDKGLLVLPMVFIYLATLLVLNGFVSVVKVKEEDTALDRPLQTTGQDKEQDKDINDSTINSKINKVVIFAIYTDEMSVKNEQL